MRLLCIGRIPLKRRVAPSYNSILRCRTGVLLYSYANNDLLENNSLEIRPFNPVRAMTFLKTKHAKCTFCTGRLRSLLVQHILFCRKQYFKHRSCLPLLLPLLHFKLTSVSTIKCTRIIRVVCFQCASE